MPQRDLSTRLCRLGRLSLIFEPRDAWVGVFAGASAVYVALVPFVVFKWERRKRLPVCPKCGTRACLEDEESLHW
jgi:hypothetical protein